MKQVILALMLTAAPSFAEDGWQGRSAAFFSLHFIDTSTEGAMNGPRADETARLATRTSSTA